MDDRARAEKRIRAKERRAEAGQGMSWPGHDAASGRLPPGQRRVEGLPILDLGDQPAISPEDWTLTIGGAVARTVTWDWPTFLAQPQTTVTADIHCVTNWSSLDNRFEGVALRHVFEVVRPEDGCAFAFARGVDGYSTNLPLAALRRPDALLCHSWNGRPLSREHGGPVRLLVPGLYFWKSAKWLRHLAFTEEDKPGFWEARGYHDFANPWREERYR